MFYKCYFKYGIHDKLFASTVNVSLLQMYVFSFHHPTPSEQEGQISTVSHLPLCFFVVAPHSSSPLEIKPVESDLIGCVCCFLLVDF